MVRVYSVVQTPCEGAHAISYLQTLVAEYDASEFDLERTEARFKENNELIVHKVCLDRFEAEECQAFLVDQGRRDYTLLINRLPNLEEVEKRAFYAYLGEDLTEAPGLYAVNKEDYLKLQFISPNVRLPQDHEIHSTHEVPMSFIPKDYELVKSLELIALRALKLDSPLDRVFHHKFCKAFDRLVYKWNDILVICGEFIKEKPGYTKESILQYITDLFPDSPQEVFDRVIKSLKGETEEKTIPIKLQLNLPGQGQTNVDFC